ncbi:hypothetical protein G6F43_007121 [Rhizopus delemar]|nr:hypothetical protein G6F43_007121 [Rhizopus delemar]
MTLNDNFIDNFARILKSFDVNNGHEIAGKYTSLTSADKYNVFRQTESNTWKLIATLASSKNKSQLHKLAALKDWVAKVTITQDLQDRIAKKALDDEELEGEIMHIVRKNSALRPSLHEPPNKKRRMSYEHDIDAIYKQRWDKLRAGEYELAQAGKDEDPAAVYMYNEYVRFNLIALGKDNSQYTKNEWIAWHACVQNTAKNALLGHYEKLLYDTLAGDVNSIVNSNMCQTWEDVIWANLNGLLENEMNRIDNTSSIISIASFELASSKDFLLERGDPRIFFHQIQSTILQNNTSNLIEEMHKMLVLNRSHSAFYISEEYKLEALRFISTLILFGRQYLDWEEDEKSTAIVAYYTEMSSRLENFRPLTIAAYASRLPETEQTNIYSQFLEGFIGDKEEMSILILLGKQYNLEMKKILKQTSYSLINKAIAQSSRIQKTKHFQTEDGKMEEPFMDTFQLAMDWLMLDKAFWLDALNAANYIIRFFMGIRHLYFAKKILNMIPMEIELFVSRMPDVDQSLTEYRSHKRLLNIFELQKPWNLLIQSAPHNTDSTNDIRKTAKWRKEIEEQTKRLEKEFTFILEGGWLGKDAVETDHISKLSLQKIYIPELVIQYHQLLHLTSTIIPKNSEKSRQMSMYITVKQKELFHIIKAANRMKDVTKEFTRSIADYHKAN